MYCSRAALVLSYAVVTYTCSVVMLTRSATIEAPSICKTRGHSYQYMFGKYTLSIKNRLYSKQISMQAQGKRFSMPTHLKRAVLTTMDTKGTALLLFWFEGL